jgi:transposase
VEKFLGSLPVVADFCRRLRIREVIDELCPMREVSTSVVSHGQMVEVLVANRLTSPTPLAEVEVWAREWAVGEVFGVLPEALNDDRAGRALDAIAEVLDKITGSVGLTAIEVFGLDVTRMHWDMTSISLHGAYPDVEEEYAVPKFGHPKDRRPDLKQIQTGLGVTGDGGVPVFARAYDGGAGEVGQVVGAMQALQKLAGPARMLIVGDSKLVSYTNLATMIDQKVTFIAPASKTYVPVKVLAAQDLATATAVDYVAARDAGKPADRRGRWHVHEDTTTLAGPRKKDPVLRLRRVFVHSSARAQAAATARAKKLDRATGDLTRLGRGLGSRHYPDTDAVTARITAIARHRRVGAYLRATVTTCPDTGKPLLDWHFDPDAIAAEAAADGWYALLTNQTPAEADPTQILRSYKGQEAVERRYHGFKGPLAVAPMFLRNNKRITALITVITLALLIYCLVEREVRNAIAPATTLPGLGAGRPAKPTANLIFKALRPLRLIPARNGSPPVIPQPSPDQLRLLNLLAVDPRRPRDG